MGYLYRWHICKRCNARKRVQQRRKPKECCRCGDNKFFIRPKWSVCFQANGRQVEKVVGNEALASKMLRLWEGQAAEGKYNLSSEKKTTMADFALGDYWRLYASNKKSHRTFLGGIRNHVIPEFGHFRLNQIKKCSVEKWISKLDEKYPVSTVNKILALLKSIYRRANLWGETNHNPVRDIKVRKEQNEILRYLSQEEYHKLIEAAETVNLKAAITLAVGTMLRRDNLFGLKWEHCDFGNRVIIVPGVLTKNGETLSLPMIEPVYGVLVSMPRRLHCPYVLINPATGKRYAQGMRKAFNRAKAAAGIDSAFRWHDLRHTGASALAMSGVDLYIIQELLGHKDIKTTQRYAHLNPGYKKEQAEKMCQFFETPMYSACTLAENKM